MKVTDKRAVRPDAPTTAPTSSHEPVQLLIAGATEAQVVRPGDTLLLVFDRPLDPQQLQALQWGLAQHHPDMQVIVIDGAKATVIRKEEDS